jgi:hypothetical protein
MRPEAYLDTALELWGAGGETTICTLEGNCMAPLLQEGDRLTIRHGAERIHRGSIAVFRSSEGILVNRVLSCEGSGKPRRFTLKADRSSRFRRGVPVEDILGRVVGVRSARGFRDLEARPERWLGRYLALRSYVAGRAASPDSLRWRCVRWLITLRARLLPTRWSLSLLPHEVVSRATTALHATTSPEAGENKEIKEND